MNTLTILTTCSAELDERYLDYYIDSLNAWNREPIEDGRVQIILLPQKPFKRDPEMMTVKEWDNGDVFTSSVPSKIQVVRTEFEKVGNYPIWDVMKQIRSVWNDVRGKYVTFNHLEFIWGPERLSRTVDWLKKNRPVYALGNLRRPGLFEEVSDVRHSADCVRRSSEWLTSRMDARSWESAAEVFDMMETTHWMYWSVQPQRPGPVPYIEDVFIAEKAWLDTWGFTRISQEMPFQDVYDLMGVAFNSMQKHKLAPTCVRMPQSVNRLIHIWHEKPWSTWTPEIRDWFLSHPSRWMGTRYLDRRMWDILIKVVDHGWPKDNAPVNDFRHGPGGPCTRFGQEISAWLQKGGVGTLRNYYGARAA